MKRLADVASRSAGLSKRPHIAYADLASTTVQYQELMFLQRTPAHPLRL